MSWTTARQAEQGSAGWCYQRRRPEQALLYQLVESYYPEFLDVLTAQGRSLPTYVQREFEDFLKCGRLEHGFLRVRCQDCRTERLVAFSCKRRGFCPSCGGRRMVESAALLVDEVLPRLPMRQWVLSFPFQLRFLFASRPAVMGRVLGIVYRAIETHLIQQAGCTRAAARTGAVTLIQRFGSALNLNIHFHMLFLDGVYVVNSEQPVFRRLPSPEPQALQRRVQVISQRVGAYLERQGWLVRNIENTYLQFEELDESALNDLLGHSITYRIAVGRHAGRKAFTLQTVPAQGVQYDDPKLAKANGFSLHAGVAVKAHQRRKLERLCRYIARPAVSIERLALCNYQRVFNTGNYLDPPVTVFIGIYRPPFRLILGQFPQRSSIFFGTEQDVPSFSQHDCSDGSRPPFVRWGKASSLRLHFLSPRSGLPDTM